LADTREDTVQLAKDENRPAQPGGLPTGGGLEIGQDVVEPLFEIRHHVIAVQADAMSGMESRGGPAHEHRTRYQGLEVALGREQTFPLGGGLAGHAPRIARSARRRFRNEDSPAEPARHARGMAAAPASLYAGV